MQCAVLMGEKSNVLMLFPHEVAEVYRLPITPDYVGVMSGIGSRSVGVAFSLAGDTRPRDTCELIAHRLSKEPRLHTMLSYVKDRNIRHKSEAHAQ